MRTSKEPRWTIDELGARTAQALAFDYDGPPNDRVRDVPDQRTIRYYTTLGVIDRPAAMRGRTALYGRRHLLQLVAIKRLQAKGLSLADIQRQLLGLTDAGLARLARVPAEAEAAEAGPQGKQKPVEPISESRSEAFWKAAPPAPVRGRTDSVSRLAAYETAHDANQSPLTFQGIRMADDVALLVTSLRPWNDDDTQAIRAAAQPLIQLLQARGLIEPRDERGTQ
jgi:DNA-binding transcriptional MerR regulator